ncbi:MAG: DUF4253 domain-containing protein [Gaiellaceae bacterium]
MKRATLLLLALLLTGCGSAGGHVATTADPRGDDPREAGAVTGQVLNALVRERPDEIAVTRAGTGSGPVAFHDSAGFEQTVAAFAHDTREQPVKVVGLPGAVGFRIAHKQAQASLERWNRDYLRRGAYVFRYVNTQGYSSGRDAILVLPTRDKWAAVRAAAVSGAGSYGIETPAVVEWLQKLDSWHPFTIYGVGADFVEGRFASPPSGQEVVLLARSMYRFDPDIVDQGTGTVEALAGELQSSGTLYLWWD